MVSFRADLGLQLASNCGRVKEEIKLWSRNVQKLRKSNVSDFDSHAFVLQVHDVDGKSEFKVDN